MAPAFLHPFTNPSRRTFLNIVRGEGALLWDSDGNELIDGMASLWYCNIGHGRAEMAEVVATQMRQLETYSCFEPFTNQPADDLAEKLVDLSPMPSSRVFFTDSGSEAVDTAMKLARLAHVQAGHPERTLIISRMRGYHGVNYGGTSAQGLPANQVGFGPMVGDVIQVASDDIEALATVMKERSAEIAAVLTEPVQGAGGVFPPADNYLEATRRLCDQHGAYLIFDEVISAFGRLGTWFGAEHYGVMPDFLTFAKAVTSGYMPLGGVLIARGALDALESDPAFVLRHGYTYSGHASVCAAALENLAIIEREDLMERAIHVGARLSSGLRALAADGIIDGVRGDGAIWGVQLRPDQDGLAIRDRALANGGIVRAPSPSSNAFCPPLVITDAEIDRLLDIYATAAAGPKG